MQVDHNTIIRIHPAAVASIIDAHEHRDSKKSARKANFILGTLMGTADSKLITVDNAFVVQHNQTETADQESADFQYDFEHHFDMEQLFRASNKDSVVVGWFSTANQKEFSEIDRMISELYFSPEVYQKSCKNTVRPFLPNKTTRSSKPIFLRVNCEILKEKKTKAIDGLPISAFLPEKFNIEDKNSDGEHDLIWTQMACEIGCGAAERAALGLMMETTKTNDLGQPELVMDANGGNLDPLHNLTGSILEKIETVQQFIIEELSKEDAELDPNMGRMLSDIFTGVPGLDKETMEGLLNGELTDLLMVTFLSHLAKVQVTINDKLKQQHGQKTIVKRAYKLSESK